MRTNAFIICLSSFVTVTAACDLFGPARSLSHAAATSGCGPADGSTTIILLATEPIRSAPPSVPYVSVEFSQPVTAVVPVLDLTIGNGASAFYSPWPGTQQGATSGRITVTRLDGTGVEGDVDLQFPARIVKTHFTASWIRSNLLCN